MRNPKLRNIRSSVTHIASPGKYGSATGSALGVVAMLFPVMRNDTFCAAGPFYS
jgi:hypothetical protein